MAAADNDNFKAEFKKFKRRDRPLDFSEVVDVSIKGHIFSAQNVERVEPVVPNVQRLTGLLPVQDWEINRFRLHDGFYVIKNPFLPGFQSYWVHRCLVDLPLPPNVTNLQVHPDINPHTMWTEFVKGQKEGKGLSSDSSLRKLRWTTIGYHYDWDTKEYREDHYTSFPTDVGVLARYAAAALGFHNFQAEAGIINYYHLDSTLGGHTDHSELDHDAPLISVSFGQDAIFLLGGPTKATKPTAILLHSGDICVMSGPSRLAYHAVPRILAAQASAAPSSFSVPQGRSQSQCGESEGQTGRNSEVLSAEKGVPKSASVDITGDMSVCSGYDCVSKEIAGIHEPPAGRDINPLVHAAISILDSTCDCMHKGAGQFVERRKLGLQKEQNKNKGHTCHSPAEQAGSFFNDQRNEFILENIGQPISKLTAHNSRDQFSGILSDPHEKTTDSPLLECADVITNINENIQITMKTIEWGPLSVYMSLSRLNVNIRQVLKPGQVFPSRTMPGVEATLNKRPRIKQD